MTKVYPNAAANSTRISYVQSEHDKNVSLYRGGNSGEVVALTVWKKSLLLNCDGYTVYDANGNLVFRVDNYLAGNKGEIVLMDASGKSLLTIRRKRLSLGDSWLVYEGETNVNPIYTARKHANFLNTKSAAQVSSANCGGGVGSPKKNNVLYEIEGSYAQRSCTVYDYDRRRVAEIKRKEAAVRGVAFGMDVFSLIVQPGLDLTDAMAIVILLDQMFRSSSATRRR